MQSNTSRLSTTIFWCHPLRAAQYDHSRLLLPTGSCPLAGFHRPRRLIKMKVDLQSSQVPRSHSSQPLLVQFKMSRQNRLWLILAQRANTETELISLLLRAVALRQYVYTCTCPRILRESGIHHNTQSPPTLPLSLRDDGNALQRSSTRMNRHTTRTVGICYIWLMCSILLRTGCESVIIAHLRHVGWMITQLNLLLKN